MKLSISNIAWDAANDGRIYAMMMSCGFSGLEIAPTRIFPIDPYSHISAAKKWSEKIRATLGFAISSMQSIWHGRGERLFGSAAERKTLVEYTYKAIDFAAAIGCRNLVFGCPMNRYLYEGMDPNVAIPFFKAIGDYAYSNGTAIGMEANPPIYNTNYINDTTAALKLIRTVDSEGFRLNLDIGTMIENGEDISVLSGNAELINHIHISEPNLKPVKPMVIHGKLAALLKQENYDGYVSIEMGKIDDIGQIGRIMIYVREVFNFNGITK